MRIKSPSSRKLNGLLVNESMRPTKKELDKKTWWRLLKVLAYMWIALAFISPWFIYKPSFWVFIGGFINVIIWVLVIYIIKITILYVVYGKEEKDEAEEVKKKEQTKEKVKDILNWIVWSVGFFGFLAILYFFLRASIN